MNGTFYLKAPAKINIGLRVLSKRKDGFHNIETIFYPVRIYDKIEVTIRERKYKKDWASEQPDIKVTTIPFSGINNEKNICHNAVKLFFENYKPGAAYKLNIKILKNIPAGAGLGGGSSDAAAVLKFLFKFLLRSARTEEHFKTLYRIALELGSDVPFFLYGKPCYAYSRGEKLEPLPDFKVNYKLILVYPGIKVNTAWAYKKIRVRNKIYSTLKSVQRFSPEHFSEFVNDFERVVFNKYARIKKIKEKMYEYGADFSLMSGSGSAVCGFFREAGKLKLAKSFFEKRKYYVMCP